MEQLLPERSGHRHDDIQAAYTELRAAALRFLQASRLPDVEARMALAVALRELAQHATADTRIRVLDVLHKGPADLYALVQATGLDAALLYQVLGHWAEVKIKQTDGQRRYEARYPRKK